MSERFKGISPEASKQMHTSMPEWIAGLEPEVENRIQVSKPFEVGGVEIQEQRPVLPRTGGEWRKLSRAAFFSLLAHGGAFYGLRPEQVESETPEPPKTEQATRQLLEKFKQESEHNKEVREQLEEERTETIDHLIDAYLDPQSPEYGREQGVEIGEELVAPIEAYARLDAQSFGMAFAAHASGTLPSLDEMHTHIEAFQKREMKMYDERIDRLLTDPSYVWTGELESDLFTLRTAMFTGPNRFFASPDYEQTSYQKDAWRMNDQLASGFVQCQVSRMPSLLLEQVWERKGFDESELSQLRTIVWQDHIQTGIEHPDGTKWSFTDLSLVRPIEEGVASSVTGEEGVVLPLGEHLAMYLVESGATLEQVARLKELGYLPETESRYLPWDVSSEVLSLEEFLTPKGVGLPGGGGGVSGFGELGELEEPGGLSFSERLQNAKDLFSLRIRERFSDSRRLKKELAVSGSGDDFFVELPRWTVDPTLREFQVLAFPAAEPMDQLRILDTFRLWGMTHKEEYTALEKRLGEQNAEYLFQIGTSSDTLRAFTIYSSFSRTELLLPLVHHPEFAGQLRQVTERNILENERQFAKNGGYLEDALENLHMIRNFVRSLPDKERTSLQFDELDDRITQIQREHDVTTDNPLFMTKGELQYAKKDLLVYTATYFTRTNLAEYLFMRDGRAEILFDRLADEPDFPIVFASSILDAGSPALKTRLISLFERKLETGTLTAQQVLNDYNYSYIYRLDLDNATIAKKYPHVFKIVYLDYLRSTYSDFSQQYAGMYEILQEGKTFDRPLQLIDFEDFKVRTIERNSVTDQEITNFYLGLSDAKERLWLLDKVVGASGDRLIIPKQSIYSEDLLAMSDVRQTPALTLAYRPETITANVLLMPDVYAALIIDAPKRLVATNPKEAARLMREMESLSQVSSAP